MNLSNMTAMQLSDLLKQKKLSSVELTQHYLHEIAKKDGEIGAFLTVCEEHALSHAARVDQMRLEQERMHPLAGLLFGAKDNLCTRGILTTCGSRMLAAHVPIFEATGIANLQMCGMVLIGKQNMDEFGMGSSTEHSYFHPTRNPIDLSRIPGGSSGGGAAAVAAGLCSMSLGTDTGGSVRQPAAMCGVVGLTPTYRAVSRYGLIAFASSLDRIGVLCKDVTDAAYALTELILPDLQDASMVSHPDRWFIRKLHDGVNGMRIALPKEYFSDGVQPEVREKVLSAAKELEKMGAVIKEVSLPMTDAALSAYYIISCAEASSNLARYDGIRFGHRAKAYTDIEDLYRRSRSEGFGDEVKRRILLGTFVLSKEYVEAYYQKAMQVRAAVVREFAELFAEYDLILTPTAPHTAWKLGEKESSPKQMYLEDVCTVPSSLAGLPAVSICCGKDEKGLPIGLQLIAKPFDEGRLLAAAYAYERRREA